MRKSKQKQYWKFSILDSLVYGWHKTRNFFWPLIALAALTYIAVPWFLNVLREAAGAWGFFVRLFSVLVTVFILLIWTRIVLNGLGRKTNRNTKIFWTLTGIYIWRQIIITAGFLLFIVPGIVWWITYLYAPMLAVDKNLNISEAMRASRKLAAGQHWPLFWWFVISMVIYAAGFYCFKVGLLLAIPITNHAGAYVYAKLAGRPIK